MSTRTVTAVDVGADAIKVVRLRRRGDSVELLSAGWLPLAELGRLDSSTPQKAEMASARLKELVRRERAGSAECVVGISGRSTMMRYVIVPPAPPWKLDMLMKYEAAEQIPGGESCAYDWRILNLTEIRGQLVVAIAIAAEGALEEAISQGHRTGATEVEVELSSVGLMSAYRYGQGVPEKEMSMVVDIGAEEVKVVIQRGGELYFARSMPGGARRFISAVAEELDVPFADAERIVIEEGRLEVDDISELDERERKIWDALVGQANQLANGIESSVMFCQAQTKLRSLRLARVLVTGGGAKLTGLAEFLSKRLSTPVEELAPFRNISLARIKPEKLAEIDSSRQRFSTAIGLALSRLYDKAFTFRLLPEKVVRRQAFLSRGIYLWYSAAIFLLALGMMIYMPVREYGSTAGRLGVEESTIEKDGEDRDRFDEILERHTRIAEEVKALDQRVFSGRDLLRVLSQLKKVTPEKSVLLKSVSTDIPDSLMEQRGVSRRDSDEDTFQRNRKVYLRGYARSKIGDPDSQRIIREYSRALGHVDQLFENVEIVELSPPGGLEGDYYVKTFTIELKIRD